MKPRLALVFAFLATAHAVSCALAADPATTVHPPLSPDATIQFVDANAPEISDIRAQGDRAIKRLAFSLVQEAWAASANDGPVKALAVCHLKNVPQVGKVIPDMPRIVAYKRTSLKIRDPRNAPDAAEQRALDRVHRVLGSGELPPELLVQRIDQPGSPTEWRVYRPVAAMKQCVGCHGSVNDQSEALRAELKARYPDDQAHDYTLGEWRGLIRVTVSDLPAKP